MTPARPLATGLIASQAKEKESVFFCVSHRSYNNKLVTSRPRQGEYCLSDRLLLPRGRSKYLEKFMCDKGICHGVVGAVVVRMMMIRHAAVPFHLTRTGARTVPAEPAGTSSSCWPLFPFPSLVAAHPAATLPVLCAK